jgi:tetratricopeptide (TPR) repeat protein
VEYGLRLAAVQNSAARSVEALETLKNLRKLPPPSGVDPRLDIVAAQAAESLGDYTQEQNLSAHAADSAAAMGASLIAAAGRHLQCWALSRFGKMEQALAACSDAQQIYARAGDRDSVARVLITSGSILEEKGQFAPAKQRYDEAIAIHRSVGDEGGEALALNVLAVLGVDSGHYASGRALYEQSTALARKNGNQDGVILGLGNLANLALLEGDLPAARNRYDELIRICRELNSKNRIALQLGNLGDVLYLQGDLPAAHRALEESIALNTETGEKRQLSYALLSLGELLQAEDRLDEARLKKMQALDLQVSMDNKVEAADGQVALAASSIEEGHPDAAIDTLRKAIVELRALKSEDEEAQAYPILADALLHMGDVPEARRTIERGAAVNAKSRNRMVQLSFAVEEARVRGASGDAASATKILTRLIAETKRSGFYGYQLEARLALAEIESRPATNSGLARQRTLAQDANAHGFQLIARKAAALSERARGPAVAHAG